MTSTEFKVRVLNVVIGHIGDSIGTHIIMSNQCSRFRDAINNDDSTDFDSSVEALYVDIVDRACALINKRRQDIEREAFEDKFTMEERRKDDS